MKRIEIKFDRKKITKGGQNHKIISKNNFEQKTTIKRMIIKFERLKKQEGWNWKGISIL